MVEAEERQAAVNVIDSLVDEHDRIRLLFDALVVADKRDKPARLRRLVSSIAKHDLAEEVVVYPAARDSGAAGAEVCAARLEEHAALDVRLDELERLDVRSGAFDAYVVETERLVHLHTAYEERTVLEPLRFAVSESELTALGAQYEVVRTAAPLYPYLASDERGGSGASRSRAGLIEVLQRIRDAATRRANRHR